MRRILLLLAIVSVCAFAAQAFTFDPISQNFDPSGEGASRVFRVRNTGDERIAVRVSVRPRRIEPDGTEVQGKETELFTVYPRQMLLDPGEQRSVRVRWNGPAEIEAELPFRIIAEQLPVDFGGAEPAEGAAIRLTYRYEGSLYVVPPGARPDVRLQRITRDGEFLVLWLANEGNRHTLLQDLRILLSREEGGEPDLVLAQEELPGAYGENMLARSTRRFVIPAASDLWDGPLYADLEYSPQY